MRMRRATGFYNLRMSLAKNSVIIYVLSWISFYIIAYLILGKTYRNILKRAFTPANGAKHVMHDDDPRFQFEKEDRMTLDNIARFGRPQKLIINSLFLVPKHVELDTEIIGNLTLVFKIATFNQCGILREKYYHQDIYG